MSQVVFYSLVSFLSICGFFAVFIYLRLLFDDLRVLKGRTVYTVVGVKNDEKRIEGIARALVFRAMTCDSGISDSRVVFVDVGSEDETARIIKRLENDNKPVSLLSEEDFKNSIEMSVRR